MVMYTFDSGGQKGNEILRQIIQWDSPSVTLSLEQYQYMYLVLVKFESLQTHKACVI